MTSLYSKKLLSKIDSHRSAGAFDSSSQERPGMRLVSAQEGRVEDGSCVRLSFLVDEEDGVIADAKFEAYGPAPLIGLAEAFIELSLHKNHDQVQRIGHDLLEKSLRDHPQEPAFPKECYGLMNVVLMAGHEAMMKCSDIPFTTNYTTPTIGMEIEAREGGYPGWDTLSVEQQKALIEEVLSVDIRPYVEMDAGGVEIIELKGRELKIGYKGSCTTCVSSIGSTLQAIQQVLQAKIHPDLQVIPDLSSFQPGS